MKNFRKKDCFKVFWNVRLENESSRNYSSKIWINPFAGKTVKGYSWASNVWWVYKRVCTVEKLDEVYVATDDERIRIVCEANKIPVVMTASTHRAAAHRLQEVSETIKCRFLCSIKW